MTVADHTALEPQPAIRIARLEKQIRDYVNITRNLVWQRQAIFFAATTLTAAYFDAATAVACYGAVLATELVDMALTRRVAKWSPEEMASDRGKRVLRWVMANTVLSALAICMFVFTLALQQPAGEHFTPLFFLFAASIFAAMNNHQLIHALILRLVIYGVTFLAIGLLDIVRERPPIDSLLWLQFFTILFVLYFIIDCSYVFLQLYRKNLRNLEELTQEHNRTKAAFKVKSEFVSTVSHELRTPLTSVKGSLDLINAGMLGKVPAAMEQMLSIAGKNSNRLANLINDILDLQKIESGEMTYRFEKVDVAELLLEALEANLAFADSLGVALTEPDIPDKDAVVLADETRMMQVLTNILSNAVKFSHDGGRVIAGYRVLQGKVRIFVSDQGVGIPESARDAVFEQFRQVDNSDQREVGGTGLGMSITKQIIDHHGGTIDFVSEEGKGTTFFVDLATVS
ncbi:MAG: sensor histidine kinase [Marinibacterium sp.]